MCFIDVFLDTLTTALLHEKYTETESCHEGLSDMHTHTVSLIIIQLVDQLFHLSMRVGRVLAYYLHVEALDIEH